jgi:hypothetical protein
MKLLSHRCNLDRKHMLKNYANHVIRREPDLVTPDLLNKLENVMRAKDCDTDHVMQYVVSNFARCFRTASASASASASAAAAVNKTT